jgi:hypothetical protein
VVFGEPHNPFYLRVQQLIEIGLSGPDEVLRELRENRPYDYHKYYIRAFLNYSKEEIDSMSINGFIEAMAVVHELKQYWHLPFKKES